MTVAHGDFETRSRTDLNRCGLHRYVEDPSTGIWTLNWRLGSTGPISAWHPWDFDEPTALLDHIENGGTFVAHNAAFERWIWNGVLVARMRPKWPRLRIEQMSCTMVRAAALALPLKLEKLALVLSCSNRKDMDGHRLMLQMSRPRKVYLPGERCDIPFSTDEPWNYTDVGGRGYGEIVEWWGDEQRRWLLDLYCRQDVETETEADENMAQLTPAETQLWYLDQVINDRGIPIDMPTVMHMLELREVAKRTLDKKMNDLTDGAVPKCSQVPKLAAWMRGRLINVPSFGKEMHDEIKAQAAMLDDQLVVDVLETRQAAGKLTSVAKYTAMQRCVCADGRARGQFQHHGATTGRPTGRLIQFTNLPRVDEERELPDVKLVLEIMQQFETAQQTYDLIDQLVGEPLPWMSKSLRSMIKAEPGKKLVGGDLANIEGRKNAWFAGEHWKLQAFRDYDAGNGPDLYKVTAAQILGITPPEVTGAQRQSYGKVSELSLGYQGSVGAYVSMGKNYNTKPAEVAAVARQNTPLDVWNRTAAKYASATNKVGLTEDVWTGVKVVVDGWRAKHPAIVQGWYDLQEAAVLAVEQPGVIIPVYGGKARYLSANGFLWCALPCGRVIAYCRPELATVHEMQEVETKTISFDEETGDLVETIGVEEIVFRSRTAVRYWALDGLTKQWRPWYLYGGLQCENIVQAAARDVQIVGMLGVEALGYPVILHVYDELVSEVDEQFGSADEYAAVMSRVPEFCQGLPLAAKAWEGIRYAK